MSPVIEAAVIAASSTGTVAIVGYLVSSWTTTRTLRSARALAQDERLWQRRADVYAEIFAYSGHRREDRAGQLRTVRFTKAAEDEMQAVLDRYPEPE
jgi:hypothetical protein